MSVVLVRPRLGSLAPRPHFAVRARGTVMAGGRLVPLRPGVLLRGLPASWKRGLRRVGGGGGGGAIAKLGRFPSSSDIAWCAAQVARLRPACVLIDTIFCAPLLADPRLAGLPSLLLAHDLFHQRIACLHAVDMRTEPASLGPAEEAALLAVADTIVAIQPAERAAIAALCPAQRVVAAPIPALPCPPPEGNRREAERIVFLGSDAPLNLDGLRWFFAEIWPPAKAARPALRLDLIGSCGPALGRLPAGVTAHGIVADLAPLLHRSALAIAPLRAGSGLKIKLLDYARHGLATLGTPDSCSGLAPDDAAPFVAAACAPGFAASLLRLLDEPAQAREGAALAYVTRHYAPAQVFAPLLAALGA